MDGLCQLFTHDDCTWLPAFNFVFFRSSKCPVAEHIGSIIQHSYIFSYAADRQRVVYDAAGPKISLLNYDISGGQYIMRELFRGTAVFAAVSGVIMYVYRSIFVHHRSVGSELAEDLIRVVNFD